MSFHNSYIDQITPDLQESYFPIHAPVSKDGWFDLKSLQTLCLASLEPLVKRNREKKTSEVVYMLDFQAVRNWDISVMLWLTLALQYYRDQGIIFKIRLPSIEGNLDQYQYKDAVKSSEYLRRWKFDTALAHVGRLEHLMIPEQRDYFKNDTYHYYGEGKIEYFYEGEKVKPQTNRLLSIRDLSTYSGGPIRGEISDKLIDDCIVDFHAPSVGNILSNLCGLPSGLTEAFADHLVGESLQNMRQHPNATSGFLSISKLRNRNSLILAVVDNGDSIQKTILDVYNRINSKKINIDNVKPEDWKILADILDFATQPLISSKTPEQGEEIGMGLTYIKEDAVDNFKGSLTIISNSVLATYSGKSSNKPSLLPWRHNWPGNFLRIEIPTKHN